jgi:hypothetical protein
MTAGAHDANAHICTTASRGEMTAAVRLLSSFLGISPGEKRLRPAIIDPKLASLIGGARRQVNAIVSRLRHLTRVSKSAAAAMKYLNSELATLSSLLSDARRRTLTFSAFLTAAFSEEQKLGCVFRERPG